MKLREISHIKLGTPWRLNDWAEGLAIPVLKTILPKHLREYLLFSEMENDVEIYDTGSVGSLRIRNNSDVYSFFRKGTILEGKTQTRTLTASIVVPPHSEIRAPARCIYQSKGITRGARMRAYKTSLVPHYVEKSLSAGQNATWGAVRSLTSNATGSSSARQHAGGQPSAYFMQPIALDYLGPAPRSDDLLGSIKARDAKSIDDAIKKMPANHKSQIGLIVVNRYGLKALEMFDTPASWDALSETIVKNYVDILHGIEKNADKIMKIDEDVALEMAYDFMADLAMSDGKQVYSEGYAETYVINNRDIDGEFTLLNDATIHILASPKSGYKPRRKRKKTEPKIFDPWKRKTKPSNPWIKANKGIQLPPILQQAEASHIVNFLTKKRGFETLSAIQAKGLSFTEIKKKTGMSSRTVTRGLNEAQDMGLVEKRYRGGNGGTVYELTEIGKTLNPERFKATYE
jgi:DNA-binding HxlR family transcriptional regulator